MDSVFEGATDGVWGASLFEFWWLELVIAGTCVDLLTDRGIFTEGNEVKEGGIEWEIFFGVKIVNAGTCDGKVDN
jgi:hypothetical protein